MNKILIEVYKWEGKFFPFKIKTTCGECSLNIKIIKKVIADLKQKGIQIELIERPWLNNWYKVILKGGYHAPIIVLNGKVIKQEKVITSEELSDKIIKEYVKDFNIGKGIHIYTLPDCPFCKRAKELFHEKNLSFQEHDVLNDSLEMQKMLKLVTGKVHPITLPQIFIDKKWIGGYESLVKYFINK